MRARARPRLLVLQHEMMLLTAAATAAATISCVTTMLHRRMAGRAGSRLAAARLQPLATVLERRLLGHHTGLSRRVSAPPNPSYTIRKGSEWVCIIIGPFAIHSHIHQQSSHHSARPVHTTVPGSTIHKARRAEWPERRRFEHARAARQRGARRPGHTRPEDSNHVHGP